jgi:hypothetical protein
MEKCALMTVPLFVRDVPGIVVMTAGGGILRSPRMVLILASITVVTLFFLADNYTNIFERTSPEDIKLIATFASVPLGMMFETVIATMGEPDEDTKVLDLKGYDYSGSPHEDAEKLGIERCYYWYDSTDNIYVIGCDPTGMVLLKLCAKPNDTKSAEDEEH